MLFINLLLYYLKNNSFFISYTYNNLQNFFKKNNLVKIKKIPVN